MITDVMRSNAQDFLDYFNLNFKNPELFLTIIADVAYTKIPFVIFGRDFITHDVRAAVA